MVYWNPSDILQALIGGLAIGAATTLHLLIKGRVTGFSGIVYSLVSLDKKSFFWKLALMSSVLCVSSVMYKTHGTQKPIIFNGASPAFDTPLQVVSGLSAIGFAFAGFLVGFGTKLGNGCTSGHGVCGLPRFSKRSFVAVLCFMGCGVITATLKHHFNIKSENPQNTSQISTIISETMPYLSLGSIILCFILQAKYDKSQLSDVLVGSLVGGIFGFGLVTSGMVRRSKIINFLTLSENWDPSLMFVMVSAVGFNLITFNSIIKILKKPLFAQKLEIPTSKNIDLNLIAGASIFGMGWGIGGLCPGPGFALLCQFSFETGVAFLVSIACGQKAAVKFVSLQDSLKKIK